MIISHQHRYIFFAVPKTATHAVREALRQNLGPDDWEQQVLFGRQVLPILELAKIQHGHLSAQQIKPHLSEHKWESYFKFGFVRNPYDRFVSTCFFLNRKVPNFAANATAFMKQALTVPRFRQRVLVRPQQLQLTGADGQIALDYVGRFETLQASYDEICSRIEIPSAELPHKNASDHSTFAQYYDDELREIVADYYATDLKLFNYNFSSS